MQRFLIAGALALSTAAGGSHAATLKAFYNDSDYGTVIGADPDPAVAVSGVLAFEIEFDDTVGSTVGVLEASEFLSFAWINDPYADDRDELRVVPLSSVSEYFRLDGNPAAPSNNFWVFAQPAPSSTTSIFQSPDFFSYAIDSGADPDPDPDPSVIPLPPAAALMLAGLGGLVAMGRRRGIA